MKRGQVVALVIILVTFLDQWLKFYIKLNLSYNTGFNMLGQEWAQIHFIENNGMAFGLSFGGEVGKYFLSIFRIVLVGFLFYIIYGLIKAKESYGLLISFALIIAGAMGNIIDGAFYGLIFSDSLMHGPPATLFPEGGGYGSFLQGRVVDMFYFPLIDTTWPSWVPGVGGERLQFFRPIFNLADASISVGVALIILFYRKFFSSSKPTEKPQTAASQPASSDSAPD